MTIKAHADPIEHGHGQIVIPEYSRVRLSPRCNMRRAHNITRVEVIRYRPRKKTYLVRRIDTEIEHQFEVRPDEIEAIYRDTSNPPICSDVSNAARELLIAKDDLREFESANPNDTTREWEAFFYALEFAELNLRKQLRMNL